MKRFACIIFLCASSLLAQVQIGKGVQIGSGGGGSGGGVTPAPQHAEPYYNLPGTNGVVSQDAGATTDGSGNKTLVSITPNNPNVPVVHNIADTHTSSDFQQTNSFGLSGNNNAIPWYYGYIQTKRNAGGNFVAPLSRNVEIKSGYENLNNANIFNQVGTDNATFVLRSPAQAGGIHAWIYNCYATGDCIHYSGVQLYNGISRGNDEGNRAFDGRQFTSPQNTNWAGTLTLGSTNSIGDQAQTLNCGAIAGGYCGNTSEMQIMIDITKKTGNFTHSSTSGSADGQFTLATVTGHGLGISTFTSTTSAIDSTVYNGICPTHTATGTTYPTIGANINRGDGFTADITGVGIPQINANFVNAPGGAMVGYCISVVSSSGFSPGDKIAIYDKELDPEFDTILAVPDATHITAYIHNHHESGAIISKSGGVGWAMCNTADDYPVGFLNAEQNPQNVISRLCYPIAYTPDANTVALFTNADVLNEHKTRGFNFTQPQTPAAITATGGGSSVNSITISNLGNYGLPSNGFGGMRVLPAPTTTSDCSGTQPNITWAAGINVNTAAWVPTLTNPGSATGCPSTPHITVASNTVNNVYFVPVNWTWRIADPNNPSSCATTAPSTCATNDGYMLTFPWLQTVSNGDEIDNTRWWNRYPNSDFRVAQGDPVTNFSGRTGPAVLNYNFVHAQSGQGYMSITDGTPSTEYVGAFPDWAPTTAHPTYGQKSPGSALYFMGSARNIYLNFPPSNNWARTGPTSSQAGTPNIGGAALFVDCNPNPFGGLVNQDDPCFHGQYYAWSVFQLNYGNHDALTIDPGNDTLSFNGNFSTKFGLAAGGLAGSGVRCIHTDAQGNLSAASGDCAAGGSGSVTSVALTMPGIFSVAGSPVTTSGTLAATLATQSANIVWAGPTTGSAAAPTFRALVAADLPIFSSTLAGAVSASGGGTANFLRADGTWAAPTGSGNTTSTSLTTNKLSKANGANSIIDSSISDDGTHITTTEDITANGLASSTDGVHAAILGMVGNTTLPTMSSNSFNLFGPNSASFTSIGLQWPATLAAGIAHIGTPSSNVSQVTFSAVNLASGDVTGLLPNANLANTVTSVNGVSCTLGSSCTVTTGDTITSPSSTLTIGGSGTATTLDVAGSVGKILAGSTPALTFTPALGIDGTSAGTLQLGNGAAAFHTILGSAATANNTVNFFATAPTTGDLTSCTTSSTTCTLTDSGVLAANVVTATSNATAANQILVAGGTNKTATAIDFPERFFIPAANCNNTTAGSGWSIGSGGTVGCRGGTNNLGGFVTITDTSSTFAQFTLMLPADWDSATRPYIKFYFSSASDTTNGHTVIPQIKVSCPTAANGTTSDDATFSAAQSSGTVTFGASAVANGFYNGSSVQIGSTQMTGCIAGGMMIVQVGRATDTATGNINFYGADVTFPRLLVVQAN